MVGRPNGQEHSGDSADMTIHTILDDAEPDDAAKAARVMASAVAGDESLAERVREKARLILSKTHDELTADITKARILKAEAYHELTKLEGAE
jgi:DNA-binding ferritin-like protein